MRQDSADGRSRVRCTTLMRVTEIRPAADADAAQWLLWSDVDWWDLVRYGPPGFDVYVRIAFPQESEADAASPTGEAPVDAVRAALATLVSYTTTPARGYAAIWEGWCGEPSPVQAPRVDIPHRAMLLFTGPAEALRYAPALAWFGSAAGGNQAPHLVWPQDQPGAWPVRSTRRSSSPWVVPATRPELWLEPFRARFDECATGNRLRFCETRPRASIRTSVRVPDV